MTYQEFLKSSPRVLSQMDRLNQNYEKNMLLDVAGIVLEAVLGKNDSKKESEDIEKQYVDSFGAMFDQSGT